MLWFFQNGDGKVSLETRYDSSTEQFVVVVQWPDGTKQVERFDDAKSFRERLCTFEDQFESQNFEQVGGPVIQPNGWRHHRLPKN
jgi:hypothetical protein